MKNKIINYIKAILFWTLIILIFFSLNNTTRLESKTNRWYQFKQLPKNSLDIVFMGNSHNMQGVIPKVSEDILNLKGFTIGVPGESLQTTYFELVEIFKTQSPKYIALETFTLDTNLKESDGHIFAFIDSVPINLNIINTSLTLYNLSDAYNYFSFIRQHSKIWKQPELFFSLHSQFGSDQEKNNDEYTFYLNTYGYYANDTQILKPNIDAIEPPIEAIEKVSLNQETIDYLNKIIELCEQNDAELILFTMSEMRDMLGYEHRILDYQKTANDYDLPYFDLGQDEYSVLHYADTHHLTHLGALRASLQISHNLSKLYDIPINQEIEKEYQKLNFDSYSIEEITWQFYHFKLKSFNGDIEQNEYNYVVDYNGKQYGGRPDGESEASVIIAYEGIGEYRLTMTISNPSINYEIKQNIIFDLPIE